MYFPVYVFLAEFYATAHGLPLGAIGAVFIAARLFDAVSDPVAGIASDRWSTRWGRRRPWLAAGAPLVMLSAWMLFVPGAGAGLAGFAVWLFLLTLGWTVMLTPYFAWGAELTGDYAERGRVSVWRETAGLVGTILAAVLYSLGADAAEGMRNIALLIVLAMPVACILCLAIVPEPRNFSRVSASLGSLARVLTGEPLFGRLILAFFVNSAANALPAGPVPVLRRPAPRGAGVGRTAADRLLRRRRARRAALAVAGAAARQAQDLVLGHALCLRGLRRRAPAARRRPRWPSGSSAC